MARTKTNTRDDPSLTPRYVIQLVTQQPRNVWLRYYNGIVKTQLHIFLFYSLDCLKINRLNTVPEIKK